jgi:HK97 family phage prohead protease
MPVKGDREYRSFAVPLRCRSAEPGDEALTVEGLAANYEEYQLFGRYWERIAGPAAFDGADTSDVVFRYDHRGKVMARTSNETLALSVTDEGLGVSADLSKSKAARDMHEEIKAGLVTKMSWAFSVTSEHEEKRYDDDGDLERIIRVIDRVKKIYDVSPVSMPANDTTSISARTWVDGAIERERVRSDTQRKKTQTILKIERNKRQ